MTERPTDPPRAGERTPRPCSFIVSVKPWTQPTAPRRCDQDGEHHHQQRRRQTPPSARQRADRVKLDRRRQHPPTLYAARIAHTHENDVKSPWEPRYFYPIPSKAKPLNATTDPAQAVRRRSDRRRQKPPTRRGEGPTPTTGGEHRSVAADHIPDAHQTTSRIIKPTKVKVFVFGNLPRRWVLCVKSYPRG